MSNPGRPLRRHARPDHGHRRIVHPKPRAHEALERIFARDGERCWLVTLAKVPLITSEGNSSRLDLAKDQPMVLRSPSYLEVRLDPRVFFRANRQQVINLEAVESNEPGPEGRLCVRLTKGREIEMSRRQSQELEDLMSP